MINKVILMGRLTADPELRQTQSGISMCRFTVAINRPFTSKDTGERQSDFINVVAWRATADFVARYFSKGRMIIVEGSLRNNNYTDQNGVKHYSMDVYAESATFGESKNAASNGGNFGGFAAPNGGQPQFDNSNAYQGSNSYQPKPQQNSYQQAPAPVQQPQQSSPNESLQIGDLSDFEVLSDGDVPF